MGDDFFPDSYNRPVLKTYVIKRLRQILPLEGYDPEEFSGHSIRIGGCQSLFDLEVDLRNIACAGRWVKGSQAIRLYREVTLAARSEWARRATTPGGPAHSGSQGIEGSCKGSGLFGWRRREPDRIGGLLLVTRR